jgi:hypothetical protein
MTKWKAFGANLLIMLLFFGVVSMVWNANLLYAESPGLLSLKMTGAIKCGPSIGVIRGKLIYQVGSKEKNKGNGCVHSWSSGALCGREKEEKEKEKEE